jgi:hypothetical protein
VARGKGRPGELERALERIESILALGRVSVDEAASLLGSRVPFAAGAAATMLADLSADEHAPLLAATLMRMVAGEQPDGGCLGSDKVVDAMLRLDADEPDAYRAGLRYVRREPSGTTFVDRAVSVRIGCASGLIRSSAGQSPRGGVLQSVAPLLCDDEPAVRAGTALALGQRGDEGAAALVHLKLLSGDAVPEVSGACMEALLGIDAERYLSAVEEALDDPRLGELAALALGESRHPKALAILERAVEPSAPVATTATLMLAMALLRTDAAVDALVAHVAESPERKALAAVEALTVQRHSPGLPKRLRAAAKGRGKKLRALIVAQFGA